MTCSFEEYRLKENIQHITLKYEIQVINNLLAFLNKEYKKKIEPHEIRPQDVRKFIDQLKKENEISTINRKIIHIKKWFDYLWNTKQISYDFMEKFPFIKDNKEIDKYEVDYQFLLNKRKLISTSTIPVTAKLIFIFYLRGLRPRDIFNITIDNLVDKTKYFELNIKTISGHPTHIIFEDHSEIAILLTGIERAIFRNVPYILSSRIENGKFGKFNQDSTTYYIEHIVSLIGCQFTSGSIRHAYIKYLYTVQKKSLEEVATTVGTSLTNVVSVLKKLDDC